MGGNSISISCSVHCPKDSIEDEMILRIVYLEHYRYWITLNRGIIKQRAPLRTDHKTKSRLKFFFWPRNFFKSEQGINNTWDKNPQRFNKRRILYFSTFWICISINILNTIFSFWFQWKIFRLTIITQTSDLEREEENVIWFQK